MDPPVKSEDDPDGRLNRLSNNPIHSSFRPFFLVIPVKAGHEVKRQRYPEKRIKSILYWMPARRPA